MSMWESIFFQTSVRVCWVWLLLQWPLCDRHQDFLLDLKTGKDKQALGELGNPEPVLIFPGKVSFVMATESLCHRQQSDLFCPVYSVCVWLRKDRTLTAGLAPSPPASMTWWSCEQCAFSNAVPSVTGTPWQAPVPFPLSRVQLLDMALGLWY